MSVYELVLIVTKLKPSDCKGLNADISTYRNAYLATEDEVDVYNDMNDCNFQVDCDVSANTYSDTESDTEMNEELHSKSMNDDIYIFYSVNETYYFYPKDIETDTACSKCDHYVLANSNYIKFMRLIEKLTKRSYDIYNPPMLYFKKQIEGGTYGYTGSSQEYDHKKVKIVPEDFWDNIDKYIGKFQIKNE